MTMKTKQSVRVLQRKSASNSKTSKPSSPARPGKVNLNGPLRPETILQLQQTHGNRSVQRMLATRQTRPAVQRSMLGDMWDSVTDTAESLWDSAVDWVEEAAATPIIGSDYFVTDDLAYLRDAPPKLKSNGGVLPEGRKVTVLESHKKGKKMYVKVAERLPEELLPSASQEGWTLFSNLGMNKNETITPAEPGTLDPVPVVDVDDIKTTLPKTEKASDVGRRREAAGLGTLSEDEKNALKAAGKEDIVNQLDTAQRAIKRLKAENGKLKKDKSLNKAERAAKKAENKKQIKAHKATIASLYAGVGSAVRAKIDMTVELGRVGLTPEKWFSKLYPSASFLGITIGGNQKVYKKKGWGGVHGEFYERLKVAEQILMTETGLSASELGKEMKIKRIGGLRHPKPATGSGGGVGLHSYGLAIDIGSTAGSNPYIGLHKTNDSAPVVERATQLVRGAAFDIRAKAPFGEGKNRTEKQVDQASKMYDLLSDSSEAFKIYFQFREAKEVALPDGTMLKLADLAGSFSKATGEDLLTVEEWQAQITADHDLLQGKNTDFGEKGPAGGFIGLDKRLVVAMVKAGISWGGLLPKAKDVMHFDYRAGTIKRGPVARLS